MSENLYVNWKCPKCERMNYSDQKSEIDGAHCAFCGAITEWELVISPKKQKRLLEISWRH